MIRIVSPLLGTVVSVRVGVGDTVAAGDELCVIESMKMEHAVCAEQAMVVRSVAVAAGDKVESGAVLVEGEVVDAGRAGAKVGVGGGGASDAGDSSRLAALRERKHKLTDDARQAATQKRHTRGMRTVRENIAELFDHGTFVEYGGFAVAAQRRRRETQDLIDNTPADGLVTGIGLVDGRRCAVLAYDYMVLAGTQGFVNHRKTDRILEVVERERLPSCSTPRAAVVAPATSMRLAWRVST